MAVVHDNPCDRPDAWCHQFPNHPPHWTELPTGFPALRPWGSLPRSIYRLVYAFPHEAFRLGLIPPLDFLRPRFLPSRTPLRFFRLRQQPWHHNQLRYVVLCHRIGCSVLVLWPQLWRRGGGGNGGLDHACVHCARLATDLGYCVVVLGLPAERRHSRLEDSMVDRFLPLATFDHELCLHVVHLQGLTWFVFQPLPLFPLLITFLPEYYRQVPPKVPNFIRTLFRRKIVVWFLASEILRDYWLSGVSSDLTPFCPVLAVLTHSIALWSQLVFPMEG